MAVIPRVDQPPTATRPPPYEKSSAESLPGRPTGILAALGVGLEVGARKAMPSRLLQGTVTVTLCHLGA